METQKQRFWKGARACERQQPHSRAPWRLFTRSASEQITFKREKNHPRLKLEVFEIIHSMNKNYIQILYHSEIFIMNTVFRIQHSFL